MFAQQKLQIENWYSSELVNDTTEPETPSLLPAVLNNDVLGQ